MNQSKLSSALKLLVPYSLGALVLALLLAWLSPGFETFDGWLSFLWTLLLGAAILLIGWYSLRKLKPPNWLLGLTIAAALLRLALGAFWYISLPTWGYQTEVQQAGYIMDDAYRRDIVAWRMVEYDDPLIEAFRGISPTDQYGGLLFLSAAVYRFLGADFHQPLLIIVIAASFSALAVLFTWAFSRRLWGERVALFAAIFLAFYPEAVLHGSAQMREAFLIPLAAASLYGLSEWWQVRSKVSLLWILAPLAISLPFSYPFTLSLLAMLLFAVAGLDKWHFMRSRRFWLGLLALVLLGFLVVKLLPSLKDLWILQAGEGQADLTVAASGWVIKVLKLIPEWSHAPFLLIYGVFRPLLPAALIATTLPLWKGIAIWRALGWTLLLFLSFYAAFLVLKDEEWKRVTGSLLLFVGVSILVASFRGGGDMWDSPRYRATFANLQVALAAWALVKQRALHDPWLRRWVGFTLLVLTWFMPWYVRRYADFYWPVVDLFATVGLGLFTGALYVLWDWSREMGWEQK